MMTHVFCMPHRFERVIISESILSDNQRKQVCAEKITLRWTVWLLWVGETPTRQTVLLESKISIRTKLSNKSMLGIIILKASNWCQKQNHWNIAIVQADRRLQIIFYAELNRSLENMNSFKFSLDNHNDNKLGGMPHKIKLMHYLVFYYWNSQTREQNSGLTKFSDTKYLEQGFNNKAV